MSNEFVADAKKANKVTNMRLQGNDPEVEIYDIDELRKEMEKPIYRLSKTVINNLIENISNKKEFDNVSTGLEAAKQYIQTSKVDNPAAAVRKAIKQGWLPPTKEKEGDLFSSGSNMKEIESEKQKKKQFQQELQGNPIWLKIREKIKSEFATKEWHDWLSKLKIYEIKEKEIYKKTE